MSNAGATAVRGSSGAEQETIKLGRAGSAAAPMPPRLDRELIPRALAHGILSTRLVNEAVETIVDSRGIGMNRPLRKLIVSGLIMNVEALGGDLIAAVANSGTLWAGLVGDRANLDFCNVLIDGPRRSGHKREIEPDHVGGRRVVLVDNFVRTGDSLHKAVEILSRHRAQVVGMIAISAPTDYVSFTSPGLDACPLRVMWPRDLLLKQSELLDISPQQ